MIGVAPSARLLLESVGCVARSSLRSLQAVESFEVVFPHGSSLKIPKASSDGMPVKRALADLLTWLGSKRTFDLDNITVTNELNEKVDISTQRVCDYKFKRLIIAAKNPSSSPSSSTVKRHSDVKPSPSSPSQSRTFARSASVRAPFTSADRSTATSNPSANASAAKPPTTEKGGQTPQGATGHPTLTRSISIGSRLSSTKPPSPAPTPQEAPVTSTASVVSAAPTPAAAAPSAQRRTSGFKIGTRSAVGDTPPPVAQRASTVRVTPLDRLESVIDDELPSLPELPALPSLPALPAIPVPSAPEDDKPLALLAQPMPRHIGAHHEPRRPSASSAPIPTIVLPPPTAATSSPTNSAKSSPKGPSSASSSPVPMASASGAAPTLATTGEPSKTEERFGGRNSSATNRMRSGQRAVPPPPSDMTRTFSGTPSESASGPGNDVSATPIRSTLSRTTSHRRNSQSEQAAESDTTSPTASAGPTPRHTRQAANSGSATTTPMPLFPGGTARSPKGPRADGEDSSDGVVGAGLFSPLVLDETKTRSDLSALLFEVVGVEVLFMEEQRGHGLGEDPADHVADAPTSALTAGGRDAAPPRMDEEAKVYLLQLFERLRDPSTGIEIKSRKWLGTSKKSFQNKDLVDWLLKEGDAKSRREAVLIAEMMQQCNMITPKEKGAAFTDDESVSRLSASDEFAFEDSASLQNFFVQLSKSNAKLATRNHAARSLARTHTRSAMTLEAPGVDRASRVSTVESARSPDEKAASRKKESSPTRRVDWSAKTTLSVFEHQLTFEFQRSGGSVIKKVVLPWSVVDSLHLRKEGGAPFVEISSWDMRRVCVTMEGGEEPLRTLVDKLRTIVQSFHDARISLTGGPSSTSLDTALFPYIADPALDLSRADHPLTARNQWQLLILPLAAEPLEGGGALRPLIVPKSAGGVSEFAEKLASAWMRGEFPVLSWAAPSSSTRGTSPILLRSSRPSGFTANFARVPLSTLAPLLDATEISNALEYVDIVHDLAVSQSHDAFASSRLFVVDTGTRSQPLVECFDHLCEFAFVQCPSGAQQEATYRTLRKLASPYCKTFTTFFQSVESSD